MSLLTPDFGLFFWMTVVFLCVLGILWKYGFPVIINMINERKAFIDGSLKKAHEATERLANIQKEGEELLREAREKQAKMLKEAKETHDTIVAKAESDAREQANKMIAEAKAQIEAEKSAAIKEIRSQVAQLSVQIAEKVVRQNLSSDAAQMTLIDKLLDEVAEK
ncbi:MAG: F0F1 ATP synthase subunit B [Bacteroidaceae bacterium]|nr:F0F1 ATP synthase subunit B [Bacteroidaceae bacterium]